MRSNCSNGPSHLTSINVFQNQRSAFVTKFFDYINQSPKLEYYRKVKSDFKLEDYLNSTVFKYRTALTRLRISAHCLEIERGRYGNSDSNAACPIVRDMRLCRYCTEVHQLKVIESEDHVLHKCPLYQKLRHIFLNDSNNESNTTNADAANISCNRENFKNDSNFALSKFCYKIFKYRQAFHDHLDDYIE